MIGASSLGVDIISNSRRLKKSIQFFRILVVIGIVYQLALLARPDDAFLSRPFFEDSFYVFTVARSLANGTGLSVDGVHPTNGVQPLICFINTLPFIISSGDDYLALRIIQFLQILIYTFAAFSIARFTVTLVQNKALEQSVFWLVAAYIIWNYSLTTVMLNGLETGLAVGLLFLTLGYYNTSIAVTDKAGLGTYIVLGALLGLAVLSRIDLAFLVPIIIIWHLYRAHRQFSTSQSGSRLAHLRQTLTEVFILGATSLAISSPWWIYNYTTFGNFMPISGQSQQVLIEERIKMVWASIRVISDSLLMVMHTPQRLNVSLNTFMGLGLVLFLIILCLTAPRIRNYCQHILAEWRQLWNWKNATPLLMLTGTFLFFYTLLFSAPHFQNRYLVSLRIAIGIILVTMLYTAWLTTKPTRWLRHIYLSFVLTLVAVSGFMFTWNFYNNSSYNILIAPARWILEHVEANKQVGMFQSGTTGFLASNVTNLDGKVNAEALWAQQQGRLPQYVDSMAFDYVIDWDFYTRHVFQDSTVHAHYTPIDTVGADFVVWKRLHK